MKVVLFKYGHQKQQQEIINKQIKTENPAMRIYTQEMGWTTWGYNKSKENLARLRYACHAFFLFFWSK